MADRVREILPDGVDGILDLIGGDALRSVAGLAASKAIVTTADPATAAEFGGAYVEHGAGTDSVTALLGLVADCKVDPHVRDVLSLDEAAAAIAAVESGHALGKVVLQLR